MTSFASAGKTNRCLDLLLIGLIVCGFMCVAEFGPKNATLSNWLQPDFRNHLGAEYNEIAQAIRGGRGFSDPFGEPTGPTAWMPPVLPCLLSVLYWATHDHEPTVVLLVIAIQGMGVLLTGLVVVSHARQLHHTLVGYLVFTLGCVANFFHLFQRTDDIVLLAPVAWVMWFGFIRAWDGTISVRVAILWGMFGGFSALCSPIFGTAWAILTSLRWLPPIFDWRWGCHSGRMRWICLTIAATSAAVVVTPWTIRNRIVLDRWVPIKSNAMFELWQSQCLDEDGVLDSVSTSQHPWPSSGEARKLYSELGEVRFIEKHRDEVLAAIARAPIDFLDRVFNRWCAASVYYHAYRPNDERMVWPMRFKRVVFALPFLSILAIIALYNGPMEPPVAAALWLYSSILLPYVLISYYDRYAAPLIGLKMLLVVYGFDSVLNWNRSRKRSR